jgi:hypothetical protein
MRKVDSVAFQAITRAYSIHGRSSLSDNSVRCNTRHPNIHMAHTVRTDSTAAAQNTVQEAPAGQVALARPPRAAQTRRK